MTTRSVLITLALIAVFSGQALAMPGAGDLIAAMPRKATTLQRAEAKEPGNSRTLFAQADEKAGAESPAEEEGRWPPWGAEIYTGWLADTGGNGFGYIGGALERPLDGAKALTLKFMASYLYYDYDSDGRVIDARAPGVKLQAGMKFFWPGTFFAVTGGVGFRDTDLDPDDPTSEVKGGKVGAVFDAHLIKDLSEKSVISLLGSYSTTGDTIWGRGRYKRLVKRLGDNRKIYLGVEGIGAGNSDYTEYKVGGLAELQMVRERLSVLFAAGFRHATGVDDSAYFGLEFYHRFK